MKFRFNSYEIEEEGGVRACIALILVIGFMYSGIFKIEIPGLKEIISFVLGYYFAKEKK